MSYEKLEGYPSSIPQAQANPNLGNARITGVFEGMQFKVDNRDSNSMLYMRIPPGYEVLTKPGSLVSMDPTVQVKGKMNFGWKKLFTGGEVRSQCSSPGGFLTGDKFADHVCSLLWARRSCGSTPDMGRRRADRDGW